MREENLSSLKLFEYEDFSFSYKDILKNGGSVSFSITDDRGKYIEFGVNSICNFKTFYSKGLYILEGATEYNSIGATMLLNWQRHTDKSFTKQVIVKYYQNSKVVREVQVLVKLISYSEYFDNRGKMYFELVVQDVNAKHYKEKVVRYKDFTVHMEIVGELKKLDKKNVFWSGSGALLGFAAVAGAMVTGTWTVPVVLTIIYGTNQVLTCSYDLLVDYLEDDKQIGTMNVVRDTVFGTSFNFIGKMLKFDTSTSKKYGNIFYSASEIGLGWNGFKELGTKLIFGRSRGFYVKFNPKKIKIGRDGFGAPMTDVKTQLDYTKYGYDVYRVINSGNDLKNYSVSIYLEGKK